MMEETKSNHSFRVSFDGMFLPGMPSLKKDVEGRLNAVKDLKSRPDDVIIAAYPRSGKQGKIHL
jgi:hypothetical protein